MESHQGAGTTPLRALFRGAAGASQGSPACLLDFHLTIVVRVVVFAPARGRLGVWHPEEPFLELPCLYGLHPKERRHVPFRFLLLSVETADSSLAPCTVAPSEARTVGWGGYRVVGVRHVYTMHLGPNRCRIR